MPLQLPQWSVQDHNVQGHNVQGHNVQGHNVQGHNAISYLENVPAYIRNTAIDNYKEPLNELNQRNFYKPQESPPYLASRFAMPYIYVIYHSKYTYYFLKNFQCLISHCSIKFNKMVVDALKALITLYEKGSFLRDYILIIDEMYFQKSAQ